MEHTKLPAARARDILVEGKRKLKQATATFNLKVQCRPYCIVLRSLIRRSYFVANFYPSNRKPLFFLTSILHLRCLYQHVNINHTIWQQPYFVGKWLKIIDRRHDYKEPAMFIHCRPSYWRIVAIKFQECSQNLCSVHPSSIIYRRFNSFKILQS